MSTPAEAGAGAAEVAAAEVPAAVEQVTVRATRLTWVGGRLEAEGDVVVDVGDQRLRAAKASGTADELEIEDGVWSRPEGELRFARARIVLRARSGVVADAHAEVGGATLDAARLEVEADGDLRGTDARLTPCRCEDGAPSALSFRARDIELLDADVAVIHGGSVRIFDVPVLPVPWWREPLDPRRFRMLFPELGYGTPGWNARWRAQVGVADERLRFGPAWREDRGFRAELEARGPVEADAALAWDEPTAQVRGAAATSGGFAPGAARVAWDVTVQSDSAYAADYGPAFVDRGVGWHQSRALAAYGPVRALGWLPDDGSAGTLAALRVRPELRGDGWVVAPVAGLAVDGAVPTSFAGAETVARGSLGLDGRAAHTWPWLAVEGSGALEAGGALDGRSEVGVVGFAEGRAAVPFWLEAGDRRWQLYAGVRGASPDAARWAGQLPGVGPDLRAETAVGGVVLRGEVAALWDGAWNPMLAIEAAGGGATGRAELTPERQVFTVRTTGRFAVDAGVLAVADTAVAWGDLTWHPGRLVLGGGVVQGLALGDTPSASARVGYDDGCSSAVLRGDWSPDRTLPDLSLAVELRK